MGMGLDDLRVEHEQKLSDQPSEATLPGVDQTSEATLPGADQPDKEMTSKTLGPTHSRAHEFEALLEPFRRVALEQLPTSGLQIAAPTVIGLPVELRADETVQTKKSTIGEPKRSPKAFAPSESKSVEAPTLPAASKMSTTLHIHANIANVYNIVPAQCQSCGQEGFDPAGIRPGSRDATASLDKLRQPAQVALTGPPWEMYKPPMNPDVPVDELHLYPPSPRVYPIAGGRQLPVSKHALGDIPITHTAPPEFMDKEHLEAMRDSHSRVHSDGQERTGTVDARGQADVHEVDGNDLLTKTTLICPQGKPDCTCAPDSIELFKNAATYLYKHTRTLSQDLFQAHVHVGERIERLQQINALNGGPTLPGSVHEFLQTETSQMLQDWAIAESKCSQYLCDCILADVNAYQVEEPSEGAAKSIPPDYVEPDESGAPALSTEEALENNEGTSGGDGFQSQCSQRFAELKKELLSLTERSERIKKQWANLLDLCNKLDEVAKIGRTAELAEGGDDHAAAMLDYDLHQRLRGAGAPSKESSE